MRNAECGMRNAEKGYHFLFRIPHSAFRISDSSLPTFVILALCQVKCLSQP